MATQLIRKTANRFGTWEVLYLFGCHDHGEVLHGAFMITEIKHQSSETVTFLARRIHSLDPNGLPNLKWDQLHSLEFTRRAVLHRVSGSLVTTIIEEAP